MASTFGRCFKVMGLLQGSKSSFTSIGMARRNINTGLPLFCRFFTPKHEWISVQAKIGTVGISDHAQGALGDVVYVQLPEVGQDLGQEGECGVVESVKAASDIYSPVSGKVTEINQSVAEDPSLINKSCYEKGWLFKLELKDADEVKKLMNESEYEKYLKTMEQ